MQHRANERQAKQKDQEAAKDGGAHAFEHALLLGHVSMLTAITIGLHEGQSFIITADRDEHIKVSRYIPQAYHIENFCLGHREFVNSLHIPGQVPGILISGGGDDELFIWDWRQGRLLSRTHIVPSSSPERPAQKVAVLRICSSNELVFVICER
jgi:tRNA (guanine-N(7)-)-methyltransferase subunit TRM82